ncbi:MAG: hypothetical protein CVV06_12455 [Gammaproteobacteria bacterium HGW-Gammaproteobacteria-10]|nr:MAG: hypothetical protein CVV06_12455 [Gammaproteobacteria bacterium HGW-Gammaproteobacteria-10]
MTITPNNDYKNALPLGFQLHEYRIDAVLGAGGFGITYLAQDLHLNKPVVIKEYLPTDLAVREASVTVAPKSTRDQDAYQWGLERFMAEAQTLAQFKHPNIVQVFRYFTAHGTAYIVMDYEQGESLSAYLDRLQRPLNEAETLSIFLPVLDGVRAVHQAEFLHRDIKPDNIFLRTNSTPILIDFGAARMALGERSRSLSVVVSAGFAPFEQYSSQGRQGPWTDIYALGATLYRAITGNAPPEATERSMALTEDEPDPYQPLSGRLEDQGYSPSFLAAIDRALEFRGKNRPQTVREFQYLLQGKSGGNPKSQPEVAAPRLEKTGSATAAQPNASLPTKRLFGTVVVFLIILGLGMLAVGWFEQQQEEKQRQAQAELLANEKRKQQESSLRAEAERLADEKRQLEEVNQRAEAERLAEEKRKQQEAKLRAEAERLADEKRKLEEVNQRAEAERLAEEKRKQQEVKLRAEAERLADEKRKLEKAKRQAEAERLAEIKRKQQEEQLRVEAQRLADEIRKLEEAKQQGLIAGRYRDNGDGTVTDKTTRLQWMRCSLGQTWQNQTCVGEAKKYRFNDAIVAGRQTVFAGHRDWRVPTIDELKTLIYCSSGSPKTWNDTGKNCDGNYQRPTIHLTAFPNTPAFSNVWSSSPYANHSNHAWHVYFSNGSVNGYLKTNNARVRLVRGGQ